MMENSIKIQKQDLLSTLPKRDQTQTIMQIITRAVLIAGTRPSDDEIEVMIIEVSDLINTRYQNLTIAEISETIKCGAMGDYQESYLSVRNINTWLRTCRIEKVKRQAKADKEAEQDNQMPIVERGSFFMKNIDKLPSLKKLLDKRETNRK